MQSNWRLGLGFSLITAMMWGVQPLALKAMLAYMDPVTVSWYRFGASALLALAWYGHRSGRAIKSLLSFKLLPLTALAVLGLMANYQFFSFGLSLITPSAAQIITQLAPLLLLLGSVLIFKERFSHWQWLGVIGVCSGILLFFHHRLGALVPTDPDYLLGIGLILTGAISWAAYGLAQKQLIISESSKNILLIIYLSGTLFFLPWSEPSQIQQLDGIGAALLAFLMINTIISYGCFGLAMTHWESSRVSSIITLTPLLTLIFASLLSWLKPGYLETEPLDALSWFGGLLVIASSAVVALAKSPRQA